MTNSWFQRVYLRQVGEATLRERAQEVEGRDRLVVRLQHPLGVGDPRFGRRLVGMDRMPAERRQLDAVDALGQRRPRLRELTRDPPDLDHRQRRAVRHHRGHLQQHLEPLADRDRRDVAERLGAVARLEEERPALGGLAERPQERARLAREDERRQLLEPLAHRLDGRRIGPVGLLQRGQRAPGRRSPG